MNIFPSKLGLGTAQWGMPYGVSNSKGQTPTDEVNRILKFAHSAGISMIDTASLYGNAEQAIGQSNIASFRVITKTPKFGKHMVNHEDVDLLIQAFTESLKKLRLQSVYGLLIHNADDLKAKNVCLLIDALEDLKSQGFVEKIGVSVYGTEQIKRSLDLFRPDIIQLPVNVFDQRLIQDGTIDYLCGLGVEIHARSAFLQGLLLMNPNEVPDYFEPWAPLLVNWHQFCSDQQISPLHAALGFVCNLEGVSYAVIGVQDRNQLDEILDTVIPFTSVDLKQFACDDLRLIDPSSWNLF